MLQYDGFVPKADYANMTDAELLKLWHTRDICNLHLCNAQRYFIYKEMQLRGKCDSLPDEETAKDFSLLPNEVILYSYNQMIVNPQLKMWLLLLLISPFMTPAALSFFPIILHDEMFFSWRTNVLLMLLQVVFIFLWISGIVTTDLFLTNKRVGIRYCFIWGAIKKYQYFNIENDIFIVLTNTQIVRPLINYSVFVGCNLFSYAKCKIIRINLDMLYGLDFFEMFSALAHEVNSKIYIAPIYNVANGVGLDYRFKNCEPRDLRNIYLCMADKGTAHLQEHGFVPLAKVANYFKKLSQGEQPNAQESFFEFKPAWGLKIRIFGWNSSAASVAFNFNSFLLFSEKGTIKASYSYSSVQIVPEELFLRIIVDPMNSFLFGCRWPMTIPLIDTLQLLGLKNIRSTATSIYR
jgi:hypothetical protein